MKQRLVNAVGWVMAMLISVPQSYARVGPDPCPILMSGRTFDSHAGETFFGYDDDLFFSKIPFHVFGKNKKAVGKKHDIVHSVQNLKAGELVLGFNRNGSFKIYFGQEQVTMHKTSENTYEVNVEKHALDLRDHDVFLTIQNPSSEVRRQMKELLNNERVRSQLSSVYNCTSLACELLNIKSTDYHLRVSHPDQLFRALLEMRGSTTGYMSDLLVSSEVRSPRHFYHMLKGLRDRDEYSNVDDAIQSIGEGALIAGVIGGFAVVIVGLFVALTAY